ncbi:25.3 kDa vesicle transport protein SEC22-1 [Actinidia eriantha]|uniref:25.3 kDa vesicle transport protein SEC22-1 n=1 Tax=Actinidia eriantha TaxID=165200 RepID=UPI00258D9A12|nr:25.3 kDa vesicle transport protein SEC22-1 [Actinidia eriantha]XP_057473484.1 25.3 kDa vesicle transport protein SEC22-1 [Actinidia eriantha]
MKMTIVGRVRDGLPLAQGLRYVNEEDDYFSNYRAKAEFILKEISRSGPLAPSKMTIRVDHHCFNFMVENGVCFITLCDSSYPRKLAFHYLQDLLNEFQKFDTNLINKVTKPYSFVKFNGIIGNVRRQYTDTRTQSNLSKLNANCRQDLDIVAQDMSTIVERRRRLDMLEKAMAPPKTVSPIWCSPLLEKVALKWTPIGVIIIVAVVLIWSRLILAESFTIVTF